MPSPLDHVAHRPWPLPRGPWINAQKWHNLLFAHWPMPAEVMRPLIPPEVELDLFEGHAWVGVIPFYMSGIRARLLPPVPGLSNLPELNVRTYVRRPDPVDPKPGVWFFSLDITSRLAVLTARTLFRLPYYLASMGCRRGGDGWIDYRCQRPGRPAPVAEFSGRYRPTGSAFTAQPGTLEYFLTERYRLYTVDSKRRAYSCDIHHCPWPLQPAEATIGKNSMALASGIHLPEIAPVLHYAQFLDVRVWPLKRLD